MQHNVHLESDHHAIVQRLLLSEGPAVDRVVIDDTRFLFTAHFQKSGPDLILTDGTKKLVIANYFNLDKHPDLVSPDGAVISAELVERLAGPDAPGQYAQAGAPAGAVVIGRVEIVSVNATVQHANGVVDNLKNGDSLLKGDVVMTGDGEGCTLSLIDGTALNMGSNGRMVLAELTYDSQSTSNSALINLVKGSFVFVAGQVAHTGGMRVTTPVATMGIRGTTVGTYLDADVNGNVYQLTATLLSDPGGSSGAYDLTDPVTGAVLQRVRSTATQVTLSHGANNQLSVQEETKSPAIVQHELAVAQILFPIFLANPNNAQLNQTTPQVPNNSLTPPQLLPQPPQETDPNFAAHFNLLLIGGLDAKTTSPGNNNSFILIERALDNPTSSASISINAIAGNNIINLSRAQAGFAITGNETGADGQTVTVKALDSGGNVVGSFTATAAGGNWFVGVSSDFAKALADGTYTLKATVSGTDGNPAPPATQTLTVDQTPPAAPGVALPSDSGSSATDHITNNGTLTLSGIEGGALLEYSIDGGKTWSNSFTPVEGKNAILVRQTDVAGNVSNATSLTFTLDTIAPAAPGVALTTDSGSSNSDHITNNGALTLSDIEEGALVEYSTDGGKTWSSSFTAVEGPNAVTVRQTDVAGNVSNVTSFSFVLDTGAPAQPVITTFADNSGSTADHLTNDTTPTLTITAEHGSTVNVYRDGTLVGTATETATPGVFTFPSGALADGSYSFTATATDAANNTSAPSAAFAITIDDTASAQPVITTFADNSGSTADHLTNDTTPTLTITAEHGSTVNVYRDGTLVGTATETATPGVFTFPSGALADGSYSFTATATDAANNTSAPSAAFAITIDDAAPAQPVIITFADNSGSTADHLTNDTTPTLTITAEHGSTVNVYRDGTLVGTATETATPGVFTFPSGALADGSYSFTATATDAANNTSAPSAAFAITIDDAAPAQPVITTFADNSGSTADHLTNDTTPTLTITAEHGSTVNVYRDGTLVGTATETATPGVFTFPSGALADGSYSFTATATDAANNTSAPSAAFAITIDDAAPAQPVITTFADNSGSTADHLTNDTTPTLTITAEHGSTVNVYQDGTLVGTATETATPGVFTFPSGALADGSYSFTATATDAANNTSAPSAAFAITIDDTAPTITINTIAGDNILNSSEAQAGFAISGSETGADGQIVTVKIIDSSGTTVKTYTPTAGSGSWSVPVTSADATALANGTYTVTASVADAAGNQATPATRTLIVDEDEADHWTGGNGNWSSNHWSKGVPTANSDAVVDAVGASTVTISQPSVAHSLTISAAGATVKDNVSLILSDKLTVNSGTFELANGSLQTPLMLIGIAGLFLVDSGAIISASIVNSGTVEIAGGTLELAGTVSGTGILKIDAGAALQIDEAAGSLNVAFAGSTGTLILKDPAGFTGTITGLMGSDAIDLTNINWATGPHLQQPVSYDSSSNISTLIITDGQTTDTIYLVGDYRSSNWKFSSDGSGGTIVVDPKTVVASGDTLILNDPTTSGLNGTDRIDLTNIDWATAQVSNVTYSPATNITTLVITDGTHTDIVRLMGDYTGSSWTFSSDGSGGAIMADPITTVVALDTSSDSATTNTAESSSVSSDLFAASASEDSPFTASSRGLVRHAAWNTDDHDADLQFVDAPGHAAWQGLLEFPSVFAAPDPGPPLSVLAMSFINAASSTAALASDQFRFTDTNPASHGSNLHVVEFQTAAQVAPDFTHGNPHDDQSDSLPQPAELVSQFVPPGQAGRGSQQDDSAGAPPPHGAANGHDHAGGTDTSIDGSGPQSVELVSQFVPPGQAGRGSQQDDSAGASSSHGAANGHDHTGGIDGSGPQSVELVSQFVPPGQAGRGSQQDDSAGASSSHGAANGHDHTGGTDTNTDGSGPQLVELPTQVALNTHKSPPGLSDSADGSPVSNATSNGPFEKTGLLGLDPTADQFHFPDAKAGGAESDHIHVPQPDASAHVNNLQTLIDAAAPPDHLLTGAANDASLPGGVNIVPQADPAIVHSHHGMA